MEKQQALVASTGQMAIAPAITVLRPRSGARSLAQVGGSPSVPGSRIAAPLLAASLLFEPGRRSRAEQVRALAADEPLFRVSFDPKEGVPSRASTPGERWVEVLANGLTFDLRGLAPGTPQPVPPSTHRFGVPPDLNVRPLEAIRLCPAPQLASGKPMLPVIRGMASIAAVLAGLPGVLAVGWHAARTWSAPDHFHRSVLRWVNGGAFPGLGLTALSPTSAGGLQSEGLALFTGQELRLGPELARDRAAGARLALRLLHWLVEHGRLDAPLELSGPSGEPLQLELSADKVFVGVSRAR